MNELEIWRELVQGRFSAFLHSCKSCVGMHIPTSVNKESEMPKPFVQLLTPHWQKFGGRSKIKNLSQCTRDWHSRKGTKKSLQIFCLSEMSFWGFFLWIVSFSCNRKVVVQTAWEKVHSQVPCDKTLQMKLQEEVNGGKTINNDPFQLLILITDSSEIIIVQIIFSIGSYIRV